MTEPLVIAKAGDLDLALLPALANRHGCITGATGTGKTITLQVMAEQFSRIGVPVFLADVKGDLTGISKPGQMSEKLGARLKKLNLPEPKWAGCPATLWDVFGEQGHPVRATISDMGPQLLSRLLNLNDTQEGVLALVFKIADDNQLLLLNLPDLRAMLQFVGDNAAQFKTQYGNVSAASIGAIQRGLLQIEEQGGKKFFGEPMLNIDDLLQTVDGKGVVNILAADKLMNNPRLYASFLLWLLAELFEHLGVAGLRVLLATFDELDNEAPVIPVVEQEQHFVPYGWERLGDSRPFHALRISSHAQVGVVHVGEEFVLWLGAHHVALEGRVETECMIEIEAEGADDPLREMKQLPVARKLDLPHD